jgi:hypothetical protein
VDLEVPDVEGVVVVVVDRNSEAAPVPVVGTDEGALVSGITTDIDSDTAASVPDGF